MAGVPMRPVHFVDAGRSGLVGGVGRGSRSATRMDNLFEIDDQDVFDGWVDARGRRRRATRPHPGQAVPGLRFAFYGRTSTAEFQDPLTSRAWLRDMAGSVISGHGAITSEFFDVGCSRRVPWTRRPRAAVLLDVAQAADRGFDAVVVGEFERAFTGRQFLEVAALLAGCGCRCFGGRGASAIAELRDHA